MPVWIIVSFFIIYAFCSFAIVRLFSQSKKTFAKSALTSAVFFALIFLAVWIFKISLAPYLLLFGELTILGSCFFGHYLGGYIKSKIFDRYLHAFGTFSFALITYCILDDFIATGGSQVFRALFVALLGGTLGVLFELFEMMSDSKNKSEPKSQKGLIDTDMDMVFNLIGSLLAGVFSYFLILR